MPSSANTAEEYIASLPEDRKEAMNKLRSISLKHLPKGFEEGMSYGMLCYVVPHKIYPKGYHVNPKQALPFVSIASQKNFIALYHMGIYADQKLLKWFEAEYAKVSKTKLDMGKSCIRFKNPSTIPFDLIAELLGKVSVKEWIEVYEKGIKR